MHVALLFTDIEGSTRLLEQNAVGYARMLARHHGILRSLTGKFGGREFQDAGDGFMMSFPDAPSAARAALAMQKEIAATPWPEETGAPRVRMAVHWAESEFREGQYRGAAIHATSRLLGAAQGGQILCSEAARATFEQEMPARRLGAYRLRGFEEALTVFQLDPEKVFLPLRAEFARRHNLPPSQDAFVGRDQERRELAGLLSPESAARLITLTGPGGIGKTRLALAAAYEALDIYEHGVLYVPLAGATHSEELFGAILRALECDPHAEERLVDHVVKLLAGPPTLLVLDNFEQLSAEGSLALRLLLGELPNVKLFVTSRTRLGIAGETDFPVFTLRVPEEGETRVTEIGRCEAVCLFLDRAARVRKDFVLHSDNASAIVEICRALDGMPLAIELASARAQMLTAEELASELREGLSHRDAAGEGGVRSGLQLAFDWSVRMLPPDVASFFGSLSVFSGGWTPRTAAQVCDPEGAPHARAYLHYLLTCSLVQASEHAGGMRFVMLEPIRQLSQEYYPDAWRRAESRHRACFRTLASRLDAALGTADEGPLVDEAEPEISNILSALEREPSNQDRLFSAVDFHDFAYHRSCNRRLRALLTTLRPEGGEVRLATLARAWHAAGALDQGVRELEDAEKAYRRASELFRENGETNGAMSARFNLATLVLERGGHQEAFEIFSETLPVLREMGAESACIKTLLNLAITAERLDRLEQAADFVEECRALCRGDEETGELAEVLQVAGDIQLSLGNLEVARENLERSFRLDLRLGRHLVLPEMMCSLARLAHGFEDWRGGAFFCGVAQAAAQKYRAPLSSRSARSLEKLRGSCQEHLGEMLFQENLRRGETASPEQWMEALLETGRGTLAVRGHLH